MPHLVAHYERRKDENGEYIKFANQNIDLTKTYMNYNLAPTREESQTEFIHSRLQELNAAKRKDLNVMADWVVTTPPSVIESHTTGEFLYYTYQFLESRYGKENVVSAYAHFDEVTPHLHFAFIPVTKDGRVSARDCLNRTELSRFHKDLDNYLKERICTYKGDILNGIVKKNGGNKTVEELKAEEQVVRQALEKIEPIKKSFGKIVLSQESYDFCKEKVANVVYAEETTKRALSDVVFFNKQLKSAEKRIDSLFNENQHLRDNNSILKANNKLYEEFVSYPNVKPVFEEFKEYKRKTNFNHK